MVPSYLRVENPVTPGDLGQIVLSDESELNSPCVIVANCHAGKIQGIVATNQVQHAESGPVWIYALSTDYLMWYDPELIVLEMTRI
jgi:hypothetical protein